MIDSSQDQQAIMVVCNGLDCLSTLSFPRLFGTHQLRFVQLANCCIPGSETCEKDLYLYSVAYTRLL